MDENRGQQIAATTLSQLGGPGRLSAMINARNFGYDKDGTLSFAFSGCRKADAVHITLNPLDLYDVTFRKVNTRELRTDITATFEHIDVENLKRTIEEYTGLFLSLT